MIKGNGFITYATSFMRDGSVDLIVIYFCLKYFAGEQSFKNTETYKYSNIHLCKLGSENNLRFLVKLLTSLSEAQISIHKDVFDVSYI